MACIASKFSAPAVRLIWGMSSRTVQLQRAYAIASTRSRWFSRMRRTWPGWYAGLIEFVAGLLIGSGLFTRAAAFIASGHMAVAYFWMHQPRSLWPIGDPPAGNGGTPAILFCFGFLLLVFVGGGGYSIDAWRRR